jgi:hypothetical protein
MFRTKDRALAAFSLAALALLSATSQAGAQRSGGRTATATRQAGTSAADDRLTGLMFGVHTVAAPGVAINGPELTPPLNTGFGTGGGVMVGYGFTPVFSAFASLDVARQPSAIEEVEGSFGLMHIQLGARANLAINNPKMVPYVSASVGRRSLGARITDPEFDEEYDVSFSGNMLGLGGGIQYFLNPTTTLEGGLELGFGAFGHVKGANGEGDVSVSNSTTTRLRFGVIWRP